MKLSGWARLWIVTSVAWWVLGAWWVARSDIEANPIRSGVPAIFFNEAVYCYAEVCTPCAPVGNESGPWCAYQDNTMAHARVQWGQHWARWTEERWSGGELPILLLGPLVFGGLLFGIGWVRRGFRPTAK